MGQREDIEEAIGKVWGGRYEILEFVGRGGMGLVFKAQQLGMDRQVALKVIHRRLCQDEKQVQRFEQEAKTSSRLSHPNSIRVFDYGKSEDGRLYMAMEFLQGITLGALISQERTLEPIRVIHIARQMLKSLAEAHQLGLVHRDLKPENIVICEIYGETDFVKVLDFGIAKAIGPTEEQVNLTQTGFICGTPRYLSPEQALGQEVDGRADLYSVGVLMYEMLTGRPPFIGENPISIVMKHVHDEPPPLKLPGRYGAEGQRLVWLVGRLLEKNAERRPDLAEHIVQFLDGEITQEELVGDATPAKENRGASGFRELGKAVRRGEVRDEETEDSEVWARVHDPSLPADESLPPPLPVEALLSSVPLSNAADTAMLDRSMSSLDQSTLVPASDDTALIARSDLIAEGEVDPQTLPAHEMQGATRILSTADIQASAQDTHPLPEGETKLPPPAPSQAEPTSPSAPSKKRSVGRSRREPVWARIMAIAAVLLAGVVFSYWLVKKPPAADEVVAKASEATVETDEISSPAVESSSTRAEKPLDAPPAPAEVVPAPEAPVMAVIGPDMGRVIGDALGGVEVPRRALPAVQEKVLQPETPIETAPRAAPVRPGSAGTAGAQPAPKPEPAPAPSRPVIQKEPPASPPAAVKPKPEPATAKPREEKKPQEVRPKPAAPKKPRKPARKPAKKKPKVDDLFDPF